MKIDFVIPWVDGSDPAWRKEKTNTWELTNRIPVQSATGIWVF